MNYTVSWLAEAENELATVWMSATDRAAVTRAAAELDRRLADNAGEEGESRDGVRRITFVKPLAILFEVYESAKHVVVGSVWEFR